MAEQQVLKDLQEVFDSWKAGNSNRSFAYLSRRSGVDYSIVRRTLQGEVQCTYSNVAPMVDVLLDVASSIAFLEKNFPAEGKYLRKAIQQQVKQPNDFGNTKFFEKDVANVMSNPLYFPVLAILATASETEGVSKEYLIKCLGESSVSNLNELIQYDLVEEVKAENYKLKYKLVQYGPQNAKLALQLISLASQLMASNPKAFGSLYFDSINEAALKSAFMKMKRVEEEIIEDLSTAESRGNIPVNFGFMFGRVGIVPNQTDSARN
ncbi:MAG: hypothetical protein KBD78_08325 [Oligoflexales bacterium]|nr:hypothetical protein [Oligoflexales bacterium]